MVFHPLRLAIHVFNELYGVPPIAPWHTIPSSANYRLEIMEGERQPQLEWPSFEERRAASADFLAGVEGEWFHTTERQSDQLRTLEFNDDTYLYQFVNEDLSLEDFASKCRLHDRPVVIGAAAKFLDQWRDRTVFAWNKKYFQTMDDVDLYVSTIPYGEGVEKSFKRDFGTDPSGTNLQGCVGDEPANCFNATPTPIRVSKFTSMVMGAASGTIRTGHVHRNTSQGSREHENQMPYSFSITTRALAKRLKLRMEDFPLVLMGARPCAHRDEQACVKAALQADPELDEPWERQRCNVDCEWEFYLGPTLSGSHPHHHPPAFNALVRGAKRWFVFTPEVNISQLTGGVSRTAYQWVSEKVPELRAAGLLFSEFTQLPGEVVYVPDSYPHAIINLEPSVGVAFQGIVQSNVHACPWYILGTSQRSCMSLAHHNGHANGVSLCI